jgi:TonB family protein
MSMPSDLETLIPDPDPTSRGLEPALTPRTVVTAEPKLLRRVAPTYPAAARAMSASGSVTLELWIREDGSVEFARVVSCTRPGLGFEQSALLAVREWTYDPAPPGTGQRSVTVRTDFARDERRR